MKAFFALLGLASLTLFSSLSLATTSEQNAKEFVLCKSQHSVRTIRILREPKDNCTVTYSKGSIEEVVGANRPLRVCKSILHSIQNNLEGAKWNCRNVQTAHLSSSNEVSTQ